MSNCGCEVELCPKCHGIANDIKSPNVNPCTCGWVRKLVDFLFNKRKSKK